MVGLEIPSLDLNETRCITACLTLSVQGDNYIGRFNVANIGIVTIHYRTIMKHCRDVFLFVKNYSHALVMFVC